MAMRDGSGGKVIIQNGAGIHGRSRREIHYSDVWPPYTTCTRTDAHTTCDAAAVDRRDAGPARGGARAASSPREQRSSPSRSTQMRRASPSSRPSVVSSILTGRHAGPFNHTCTQTTIPAAGPRPSAPCRMRASSPLVYEPHRVLRYSGACSLLPVYACSPSRARPPTRGSSLHTRSAVLHTLSPHRLDPRLRLSPLVITRGPRSSHPRRRHS